jgi:hypothetical protein
LFISGADKMTTAPADKKRSGKTNTKVEPLVPKKRGRKPKGGKIITVTEPKMESSNFSSNVIVHLKCKKSDLNNDELELDTNILPNYNESVLLISQYKEENNVKKQSKTIHEKLKELQVNLHNNAICDTDSCCFWCTYNFSNLPIVIPKFEINNTYHVYGCFCSPECATAYLMKENIDASIKFERYQLLCYIYTKVFDYKKNIKPAPDPRYTLNKFFGNLTIEEYRELFESQHYLFVIDKPITRELPELHEDYKNESYFSYSKKNQPILQSFTPSNT